MKKFVRLENSCKGCTLYGTCYAAYVLNVDLKKCPCSICLVKMMCNQRCIEFMDFRLIKCEDITLENIIREAKCE